MPHGRARRLTAAGREEHVTGIDSKRSQAASGSIRGATAHDADVEASTTSTPTSRGRSRNGRTHNIRCPSLVPSPVSCPVAHHWACHPPSSYSPPVVPRHHAHTVLQHHARISRPLGCHADTSLGRQCPRPAASTSEPGFVERNKGISRQVAVLHEQWP